MPRKGSETSNGKTTNGVNYAYNLSFDSWFCTYECCVHKAFLGTPGAELRTKHFQAGEYTWQLLLCHKTDGNLAAYLYNQNQSTVNVHFSFTVVNRKRKKNELWGDVRTIQPSERWGEPSLISIASMKDGSRGFLTEDSFKVNLDLRVKGPFNETHSLCADERSGTYVWKFKQLYGMSPPVVLSDEFTVCGLKWALQVYPYKCKHGKEYVSFYIYSYNQAPVRAEVTLTAINDADPAMSNICNNEYKFGTYGAVYGRSDFIETKAFEDGKRGFLKNGWITLTAHVSIPGPAKNTPIEQAVNQMKRLQVDEEPECIFCMDKPQTSGVLHGDTVHKCYCLDCAKFMKQNQKDLHCPICRQKVERIILKFY